MQVIAIKWVSGCDLVFTEISLNAKKIPVLQHKLNEVYK